MDNYERKNRIEAALNIKGLKQIELSERSGISKASINHWIKQRYQPKQKAILEMARVLDVSELWLAGYDVPMERPVEQKKNDELATIIHQLRKDERLKKLLVSISKLNSEQFNIIENMISQFEKINPQK